MIDDMQSLETIVNFFIPKIRTLHPMTPLIDMCTARMN